MTTAAKPRSKGRWACYEIFYVMTGEKYIWASSPADAMEKFAALTECELAEDAKLEQLDPVLVEVVNEE